MENNTPQVTQQIEWLDEAIQLEATPKLLRKETVKEFCDRNGLPLSNYYYHLSKPESKKRVLEIALTKARDKAPDVLETLVREAEGGDMKAMAIYMDSILRLAKQLDITTGDKPIPLLNVLNQPNNEQPDSA